VSGTRNGPHEILQASSHMELWDEEIGADVHPVGIFTLPEMELPFGELAPTMDEIRRVASEILDRDKFLVALGGEHSITPPLVAAAAARHPGLSVLQIDAHADLRDSYMGTPHNHACAMRRSLEYAPVTQVGIRSLSTEEAEVVDSLNTTVFYDYAMRRDPAWIDRIVETLADTVYITIDVDGMDPRDHAGDRHSRARRAVVVRDPLTAARDHRAQDRRRRGRRGAQSAARSDGAQLPVRQTDLQDARVSIRPHLGADSITRHPGTCPLAIAIRAEASSRHLAPGTWHLGTFAPWHGGTLALGNRQKALPTRPNSATPRASPRVAA
jgi:hypothetical protein